MSLQVTSPAVLPASLHPLSVLITSLSNFLLPLTFSGYTLPYAGLTGDAFIPSSRRSREITSIKRPNVAPPSCRSLALQLSAFVYTSTQILSSPLSSPSPPSP